MRPRTVVLLAALVVTALVLAAVGWVNAPTTLRIAVGPADRDHARLVSAFTQKLSDDRSAVRLKVVRNDSLAENVRQIDAKATDLAVARSDHMPRDGQTLAILHHDPVLFAAAPAARVHRVRDLAGKRVALLRLSEENRALLQFILKQDKLNLDRVTLSEVALAEVDDLVRARRIDAVMIVAPLQGSLAEAAVDAVAEGAGVQPVLFGVDDAEALAQRNPAYESLEVPRGIFGGAPPLPHEVVSTLAVSYRLVARNAVDEELAGTLTKLLFAARPALAQQVPLAGAIEALDPDEAASLGLHPGARRYYAGEQRSFIERYADWAYLGVGAATMVASAIGGLLGLSVKRQHRDAVRITQALQALLGQVRAAPDAATLETLQQQADALLIDAVERVNRHELDASHFATLSVINQNVSLAVQRRERQLLAAAVADFSLS